MPGACFGHALGMLSEQVLVRGCYCFSQASSRRTISLEIPDDSTQSCTQYVQTRQVPGVEAAAELPRLGGRTRPEGANTAALSDRRARMWPNVLSLRLLWRPCGVEPPLIVEPRRPTRGARCEERAEPSTETECGGPVSGSLSRSVPVIQCGHDRDISRNGQRQRSTHARGDPGCASEACCCMGPRMN